MRCYGRFNGLAKEADPNILNLPLLTPGDMEAHAQEGTRMRTEIRGGQLARNLPGLENAGQPFGSE